MSQDLLIIAENTARTYAFTFGADAFAPVLCELVESGVDVNALNLRELYLARACLAGDHAAIAVFEKEHLLNLQSHVTHLQLDAGLLRELPSLVRERLLPPPIGQLGKLAMYEGRGALNAWIKVVTLRLALNLKRKVPAEELRSEEHAWHPDPQRDVVRQRYGPAFRSAIETTVQGLSVRDRTILRLYFLDGVSMEDIAPLYKVDRSTISRWMSQAKVHVFDACKTLLKRDFELSSSEFDSLIKDLLSQADVPL